VRDLALVHRLAVHAVPLEPGPVVGEVGADGADEGRLDAELGQAEADVRADAAAPHHEVVDQERQRHLV
jgi:hypothetical protein